MTQAALIGTAFEYATISNLSARIRNDIQTLLQYASAADMPQADVNALSVMSELMAKYHFGFNPYRLQKKLNELTS